MLILPIWFYYISSILSVEYVVIVSLEYQFSVNIQTVLLLVLIYYGKVELSSFTGKLTNSSHFASNWPRIYTDTYVNPK